MKINLFTAFTIDTWTPEHARKKWLASKFWMVKLTAILPSLLFFLLSSNTWGAGWNDFNLDIGNGYSIIRANRLEVCLAKSDGSILLLPQNYDSVGPIIGYVIGDDFILTKNAGRRSRDLTGGDTLQEVDHEAEYFFIYQKKDSSLLGPFQRTEFVNTAGNFGFDQFNWIVPKNPNFWRPLIGGLIFLTLSIPILAAKYYYILVPAITIVIIGIWFFFKKDKN